MGYFAPSAKESCIFLKDAPEFEAVLWLTLLVKRLALPNPSFFFGIYKHYLVYNILSKCAILVLRAALTLASAWGAVLRAREWLEDLGFAGGLRSDWRGRGLQLVRWQLLTYFSKAIGFT